MSDFEGLWQYPGRGVWIHVWPDGFAFQCRIAPDGTVFASAGALAGSSVSWQQIWPVGSLALTEDGLLHLEDAWGVYLYQPGCPMSPPCTERLPRPVGEWKPRPPTVACVRGG